MTEKEVIEAIKYMQEYQTETDKLEAKTAEKGCPQKCYDTISAFANKRGGIIIFGINEHNNFIEQDVYDVNDLQKQITSLCTTSLEPKIRPEFLPIIYRDKKLLAVKISEIPQNQKPCYYKGAGINRGSYIRIGDSYDDRIQIISPGSLYGGIKPSDLGTEKMLEARNKTIVRILEETTDLVENRHTGIETMREEMKNMNLPQPEFIVDNRDFTVIFRKENKNDIIQNYTENYTEKLNKTQIRIMELMKENPNITQKILAEKLKLSRPAITLNIKELKNKNYIERVGSDRKGYWKIIDNT